MRWCGNLIAWANDCGVKIYDLERERPVSRVDRPNVHFSDHEGVANSCQCKLYWENNQTLLIGWGDCWMIVKIQEFRPTLSPQGLKDGYSSTSSGTEATKLQLSGRIIAVFHVPALIIDAYNSSTS